MKRQGFKNRNRVLFYAIHSQQDMKKGAFISPRTPSSTTTQLSLNTTPHTRKRAKSYLKVMPVPKLLPGLFIYIITKKACQDKSAFMMWILFFHTAPFYLLFHSNQLIIVSKDGVVSVWS